MMMSDSMTQKNFDIADLVDDLQPVGSLKTGRGLVLPFVLALIALVLISSQAGLRPDLLAGNPAEVFLLRTGILALLGGVTAHALSSRWLAPAVGKHSDRWQMALAGALLFPLAAMIVMMTGDMGNAISKARYGVECLVMSGMGAFATAIPMVLWLRKGAPTSPERAGWLTGIASGGLGAFAYNFHCSFSDIVYTGVWYSLAVLMCAVCWPPRRAKADPLVISPSL